MLASEDEGAGGAGDGGGGQEQGGAPEAPSLLSQPLLRQEEEMAAKEPRSFMFIICINVFMFGYGAVLTTYCMIILPREAERWFPESSAIALAVFLFLAGVSQLVSPAVGFFSDRSSLRLGRRRPFMIGGAMLAVPCIIVQLLASRYAGATTHAGFATATAAYVVSFCLTMVGMNVVYTAVAGMVPDLLPPSQTGKANGVLAFLTVSGNCAGFLFYEAFASLEYMYLLYAAVLTFTVAVTVVVGKEERHPEASGPWRSRDLWGVYYIDRHTHPDFFWVFVSRTSYYMGISVNAYMQYFFRDVVNLPATGVLHDPVRATSVMAMVGQAAAALGAYPAGLLSDLVGRKPLIVAGCAGMGVSYICMLFITELWGVLGMGAICGFSNGIYVSSDFALAVDTLPSRESAARHLGVWGVGAFIGTMLSPIITGPLLFFVGRGQNHAPPPGTGVSFTWGGYAAVLGVGTTWLALSAALLRRVKSAR